jgi:uncharacterized membrane protein YhaH (DUF805 family)
VSSYSPAPITSCNRCGAELPSGAKYCSNCGQAVGSSTSTFAPSPQPTPPANSYSTPSYSYTAPIETRGGIGKLFSGSGRIGRLEWFLTVLGIWLVLIVAWGIIAAADAPLLTIVIGFGSLLVSVVVAICASVKRLHDFNQSGWLYLLVLVPIAGFILLVLLLLMGPSPGRNTYGFEDSGSVIG